MLQKESLRINFGCWNFDKQKQDIGTETHAHYKLNKILIWSNKTAYFSSFAVKTSEIYTSITEILKLQR